MTSKILSFRDTCLRERKVGEGRGWSWKVGVGRVEEDRGRSFLSSRTRRRRIGTEGRPSGGGPRGVTADPRPQDFSDLRPSFVRPRTRYDKSSLEPPGTEVPLGGKSPPGSSTHNSCTEMGRFLVTEAASFR